MRNIVISIAAVAALTAIAAPAAAQQQNMLTSTQDQAGSNRASAPTRQQPRVRENDDRRICMSVQLSGSRMRREVCRTEREWQARGELNSD